jgi:hypothetical protein
MFKTPDDFIPFHPLYNSEIIDFFDLNNINGCHFMRNEKYDLSGCDSIIINLDDKDNTGSHYVAIFLDNNNTYYFDPFGVIFPNEVSNKFDNIIYSTNEIQPIESFLCGYYCLYFLYYMNSNNNEKTNKSNFYDFIYLFDLIDKNKNDDMIKKLFDNSKGSGFDLIGEASKLFKNQEWHLRDIKIGDDGLPKTVKHNWTGPFSDNEKKISNWDELRNMNYDDIKDEPVSYTHLTLPTR